MMYCAVKGPELGILAASTVMSDDGLSIASSIVSTSDLDKTCVMKTLTNWKMM